MHNLEKFHQKNMMQYRGRDEKESRRPVESIQK